MHNRFTKVSIISNEEKVSKNFLTPSQLVIFLDDTKKHESITNYSFLLTVAYSGVRKGEALGLQWKNVDFENNTITIERTSDYIGTRTPKTKNSNRTILVDKMVMNQLDKYMKWCKKLLFSYGKILTEDTFVFISDHGANPLSRIVRLMERIFKRTSLPKITLHDLRHTHCTILLNRGLNVKVIAERLGNTPQMIHEIYGHVLKELEQESVTLFSQSLEVSGATIGAY